MVPVAGSAYTYSYAVMGELLAWMVGWALILEYALGASAVAVGWSGHIVGFLDSMGVTCPMPSPSGRRSNGASSRAARWAASSTCRRC
jgi:APA family basic amino acid/polyamine antiporter